ncbi:hypothetical protein Ct61P_15428 [Colletotrichum tofieldiae]|nr:hypothetical protein Ct61P_15428 [Colletotrichum tofieldiae]
MRGVDGTVGTADAGLQRERSDGAWLFDRFSDPASLGATKLVSSGYWTARVYQCSSLMDWVKTAVPVVGVGREPGKT